MPIDRSNSDDPHFDANTTAVLAGRYQLDRRLGSGGMAEVWSANDLTLGRPVAVKILHRHLAEDELVLTRFRAEAQSAARLTHPGIVAIFDTILDDDVDAIIMEHVDGEDLRTVLDQRKVLAVGDAVEVATQIAQALGHAHQHSIVHRDVKPANILIRPDRRVKLSDFGIAKALDNSTRTETGSLMGTVKYLSPEQIDGVGVDGRADLYALATVLYEMISGQVPFSDSDLASAMRRVREPAPPIRSIRPDVPVAIDDFLTRALQRDRDHRPKDAAAFISGLSGALRGSNPATPPKSIQPVRAGDNTRVMTAPDSIPERPASSAPLPVGPNAIVGSSAAARPARRSFGKVVGPLIAILLMIAAVLTVWRLLLPASEAVTDQFGDNTTTTDVAEQETLDDQRVDQPDQTSTSTSSTSTTTTTTIEFSRGLRTWDFDPFGGDGERPETTDLAIDGDPTTFWRTESYSSPLSTLKDGVGFILEFESPQTVTELKLLVNNDGWSGSVYVTDEEINDLTTIDQWGSPVGVFEQASRDLTVPLTSGDSLSSAVLLWITDLGPDDEAEYTDLVRLELFEIEAVS